MPGRRPSRGRCARGPARTRASVSCRTAISSARCSKHSGDQDHGNASYYEHRNTGITHVDLTPLGARVRYLNRVDHLDDTLITY